MNDQNETVEPDVNEPTTEEPTPTPDEAEAEEPKEPKTFDEEYVKGLRAESANYRTKLREVEALLSERKSPEEVDTLVNELRAERESAERALLIENAALKNNLPDDLKATLTKLVDAGLSHEEIEAEAKSLAKYAPKTVVQEDHEGGINPGGEPADNTSARDRVRAIRRNRF